jgi:effector-binding domain-containing protein
MGVVSSIGLYEVAEQWVASIRTVLRFEEFPSVAQESYGMITKVMHEKGVLPSSPPFVCYHNADLQQLDVEMGFPIAKEISLEHAQVTCHMIPAQRVVSALFQGPYEESDVLLTQIFQWVAEHGYEPEGTIYNSYLNDEERPREELLTKIGVVIR